MCRPYQELGVLDAVITYRKTFVFEDDLAARDFVIALGLASRHRWYGNRVTVYCHGFQVHEKEKIAQDHQGSPAEGEDGNWIEKGR